MGRGLPTRRVLLAAWCLCLLPACSAEGLMLLAWCVSSLLTASGLYLGRVIFSLDWTQDRRRVLQDAARRLELTPPAQGDVALEWTSPQGLPVRAHATPALELRMPLADWVPRNLVVDTIAPPMRGLLQLVPDPRFLEWVASGDAAELLGVMSPAVRDALLEAHNFGPGFGLSIRNRSLEVAIPWRDLDQLEDTIERMERVATAISSMPRTLSGRLRRSVESDDSTDIRRASLRVLRERFPVHPDTDAALLHAERTRLNPVLLPAPHADSKRGRLALMTRSGGTMALTDDEDVA